MGILKTNNYVFLFNFTVFLGSVWLFLRIPQYIAYILLFLVAAYCLESIFMLKNSPIDDRWWNLAIFPSVASVSLLSALTVLSENNFFRLAILAVTWLIASYWRKAYLFFHEPRRYRLGSLEYLADYGNILIIFFLSISFYGFRDYLDTPFWILSSALAALLGFLFYYFFWSNKLPFRASWPYLLVSVAVLSQLAWAISLLPFTFMNSSILFAVLFYAVSHLQKLHLQAKLTNEKIRHYIAFVTLTFIIIFLSARWL
jgi:hypothetical protein